MHALQGSLATCRPAASGAATGRASLVPSGCASVGSVRRGLSGASVQLGAPRRARAPLSRRIGTCASLSLEPIEPAQFEKDWQDADKAAQKVFMDFDKVCMQPNVSRFRARRTLDLEIK